MAKVVISSDPHLDTLVERTQRGSILQDLLVILAIPAAGFQGSTKGSESKRSQEEY